MSAAGYVITEWGTTLVSDGLSYNLKDEIIHSTSTRKVWKLSPQIGLIWMGVRPANIDDIIESVLGLKNPKMVIDNIVKLLKTTLTPEHFELMSVNDSSYSISVFYYSGNKPGCWNVRYPQHSFDPVKIDVAPNSVGAMVIDTKDAPFKTLLAKIWNAKYVDQYLEGGEHAILATENATKEAFQEMVDAFKDSKPVGGELFIESITPQIP